MSLKTSYTDATKYTSKKLQVRYRVKQIVTDALVYYEVHRFATKSYAYLGLTEDSADQCAAAKVAQYTRTTYQWTYNSTAHEFQSVATTECMADISVAPNGPAWEVSIDVNEDDVVLVLDPPSTPATLFTAINSRSYDGGSAADGLSLTSASRSNDSLAFSYTQNIPDFTADALVCQYVTEPTSTAWAVAPRVGSGATPVTVPDTGTLYVRLVYGMFVSNVVEVS